MSIANSHVTPLPDVNTHKYRRYADGSISQGGFPQPGSLRAGWAVRVTCRASAERPPHLPARDVAPADAPPAAIFQRVEENTELGNLNLALRAPAVRARRGRLARPSAAARTGFPRFRGRSTRVAAPRVRSRPPCGDRGQRRDLAAGKRCLSLPATCLSLPATCLRSACDRSPGCPGIFEPGLPAAGGTGPIPVAPGDVSHPCAAKMVEGGFAKLFQKRSFLRLAQKYQPLGSGEQEEKVRIACPSCLDLLK